MFSGLWNFISTIGIKKEYDDSLIKRITLTNQFSTIALVIFLLSGFNNLALGDLFSGLLLEGFVLICVLGLYINSRHYHAFAISFLFITINVALFYFNSYSGMLSGTYLYYFPLILAIAFVFNVKEDKNMMLMQLLLILTSIFINVFTHYTLFKSSFITDDKRYQMFMFNLVFSCCAVGFFIYLTVQKGLTEMELYNQRLAEHTAAEKQIKEALAEKEVLLSELHHRVKNNLAIISGLFNLKINAKLHEDARSVLIESRDRVVSMALIHNRLYTNNNFTDVNFEHYTNELVHEINRSYPSISGSVKVTTQISDVVLDINTAVPCGLILNELLTNCYKHAFVNRNKGWIDISFTQKERKYCLTVKDDGVGLAPGYNEKESLGFIVIDALSDQIGGAYTFVENNGTQFKLTFGTNSSSN